MITFDHVSKTYPDGSTAVHDFSLVVPSHHIVSLVGTSGSGKTTLIRMVNRMTEPTSGQVCIDDHNVMDESAVDLRRRIGYVIQSGGLMPHKTVEANIAVVPTLQGTPRREARKNARKIMERVGLDPALAKRYPHQLSGGQQQRVGVARALASNPNILLMDEPFGAVDPIVRRELQDELLRLQQELGKTILFVTHDIDEAFRLSDSVVILEKGGVISQHGPPSEIMTNPKNDFAASFTGASNTNRKLTTRTVNGQTVAVDSYGRSVGVLTS